jgi:hypothetical protein
MSNEERRAAILRSAKPTCMIIDLVGITGIADCASTASIMAGSKPDEVIERANANMLAKPKDAPIDVAAEIRHAEEQIEGEKKAARQQAEEREQARLARIEQQRREREEMAKRARLDADVRYQERQVANGGGGRVKVKQAAHELATVGQQKYLWVLGMRGDLSKYTKKQAGRMISQLKAGQSPSHVSNVNPTPGPRPKTEAKQLSLDDINSLFMETTIRG